MFSTQEVDQGKFIIVAAPIGDGSRGQLNIYEQRSAQRPCYAVSGSRPALVDPLLASFDFTGICNRFIDGNGYSLRIGTADLGTVYRLSVVKDSAETLLMAQPTRPDAGPEMVVARTGGQGKGFLLLVAEPGWRVMRRSFGSRALGHVYVYRDSWPEGGSQPQAPLGEKPAASGAMPAAAIPSSGSRPNSGSVPSSGAVPSQGAVPAQGTRPTQRQVPGQGAAPKPGLGASAPLPTSGTPKPVAAVKPIGPANPVQGPRAGAATSAAEPANRPRPVAAASKPTAAAPLAAAPNLPALPAAAPGPAAARR